MKCATLHLSNRKQRNNYYDFRMNLPACISVENMRAERSDIGEVRFGTKYKIRCQSRISKGAIPFCRETKWQLIVKAGLIILPSFVYQQNLSWLGVSLVSAWCQLGMEASASADAH